MVVCERIVRERVVCDKVAQENVVCERVREGRVWKRCVSSRCEWKMTKLCVARACGKVVWKKLCVTGCTWKMWRTEEMCACVWKRCMWKGFLWKGCARKRCGKESRARLLSVTPGQKGAKTVEGFPWQHSVLAASMPQLGGHMVYRCGFVLSLSPVIICIYIYTFTYRYAHIEAYLMLCCVFACQMHPASKSDKTILRCLAKLSVTKLRVQELYVKGLRVKELCVTKLCVKLCFKEDGGGGREADKRRTVRPPQNDVGKKNYKCMICVQIDIYIYNTSSGTAQCTRRWRKFQKRKPIGEFGCCEPRMAEWIRWWTERWLELCFFFGAVAMSAEVTSLTNAGCSVVYCSCSCSWSVVEL